MLTDGLPWALVLGNRHLRIATDSTHPSPVVQECLLITEVSGSSSSVHRADSLLACVMVEKKSRGA